MINYKAAGSVVNSCHLQVSSNRPDLHSGVDGGAIAEPMFDMYVPDDSVLNEFLKKPHRVRVLSTLADAHRKVTVPKFCPRSYSMSRIYFLLTCLLAQMTMFVHKLKTKPVCTKFSLALRSNPPNHCHLDGASHL